MRLIDADAIKDSIFNHLPANAPAAFYEGTEDAIRQIEAAPTIDPETMRPTAHWVWEDNGTGGSYGYWVCSNCNRAHPWVITKSINPLKFSDENHCPICGAKMEEADDKR